MKNDTLDEQFASMFGDEETASQKKANGAATSISTPHFIDPLTMRELSGYEFKMRKHAAACEAGR